MKITAGVLTVLLACESPKNTNDNHNQERNTEAREDSVKYNLAVSERNKISHMIPAVAETDPVGAGKEEDAADDPATW